MVPDFRGQAVDKKGKLASTLTAKWKCRMQQFGTRRRAEAKRKPKVTPLQQQRLANTYHCMTFDNALALGAGMSCQDFVMQGPPRALKAHEERFFISVDSCPESVRTASADRELRSCIKDKAAGKNRLEVCWGAPRKIIHSNLDEGGDNLTNKFWLFLQRHVRGWLWVDPTHRRHNNWTGACSDAKAGWGLKDMALVCSTGPAPWGRCGHFGKRSEALQEYTENFDHIGAVWCMAYPYVAWVYHGGKLPHGWMTEKHSRALWDEMEGSRLANAKGDKA